MNWSWVLGLAGTLSLHGLAVESLILGSGSHKPRPPDNQGVAAIRVGFARTPAEGLLLVIIADTAKEDADLADQIASLTPQLQNPSIAILSPDALLAVDADSADETPSDSAPVAPAAGDPAVRALMFGRYAGQISARIERAWDRPRSPVNDPAQTAKRDARGVIADADETFRCRVQVRQDVRGNVQEVLLLKCNGTEAWQHSLVLAINQSSPLPAPPIPTVFTKSLTMTFEAHAYQLASTSIQPSVD